MRNHTKSQAHRDAGPAPDQTVPESQSDPGRAGDAGYVVLLPTAAPLTERRCAGAEACR